MAVSILGLRGFTAISGFKVRLHIIVVLGLRLISNKVVFLSQVILLQSHISSCANGIEYFWVSGQLLCKAQRREHSLYALWVVAM